MHIDIEKMKKIDYGIDAPHVIRNLLIASAVGFLVPVLFPLIRIGQINFSTSGFILMGISCGLMAGWMLLYSLYGKLRHRDRILNMIDWKGNEMVLDIGTGRGLLMIGAAKRLSTGKAVGIDIWNTEDLTKNTMENTIRNASLEGVKDKVEIVNGNATSMSFDDSTFDIILSNLCLHNIYNAENRREACNEISRVLRKGGTAIISDFKHIKEYQKAFLHSGLKTEMLQASYFTTFPPLPILKVTKV
jgi:ubiquinone/menaquinone biosynthesis C-methylase UbiE